MQLRHDLDTRAFEIAATASARESDSPLRAPGARDGTLRSAPGSRNGTRRRDASSSRSGKRIAGRRRLVQAELFARSWGGARRGAGCKPKGQRALASHSRRAMLAASHPVHVTTRLIPGLPSLRRTEELRVIMQAIGRAQERSGMRVVHYSIQSNHLHLLVEARGRESLSLGIAGLLVRMARALNRVWQRAGRIFADRYHAHALKHPAEVRRALVYVLQNARKHGLPLTGVDACSSGAWFDGWSETPGLGARLAEIRRRLRRLLADTGFHGERAHSLAAPPGPDMSAGPIARARTWLLARGWMRSGAIRLDEIPHRVGVRDR